jgi:hypothetical protein
VFNGPFSPGERPFLFERSWSMVCFDWFFLIEWPPLP